jgi:hypothetical protein
MARPTYSRHHCHRRCRNHHRQGHDHDDTTLRKRLFGSGAAVARVVVLPLDDLPLLLPVLFIVMTCVAEIVNIIDFIGVVASPDMVWRLMRRWTYSRQLALELFYLFMHCLGRGRGHASLDVVQTILLRLGGDLRLTHGDRTDHGNVVGGGGGSFSSCCCRCCRCGKRRGQELFPHLILVRDVALLFKLPVLRAKEIVIQVKKRRITGVPCAKESVNVVEVKQGRTTGDLLLVLLLGHVGVGGGMNDQDESKRPGWR